MAIKSKNKTKINEQMMKISYKDDEYNLEANRKKVNIWIKKYKGDLIT